MELPAGKRTTQFGVFACAISVLLSTIGMAQSPPEPSPDATSQQQVPLEVYTGPHPKKLDVPGSPAAEFGHDGWVELAFMVSPKGKPFEITVIRSTGSKDFERVATEAIKKSTFEPGTLNGAPVEAGYELKYIFYGAAYKGASRGFFDSYKSLMDSIKTGDRAGADAVIQKLKITNLYEDAYFGLATYNYAAKWGDDSEQLDGLRRAIAREDTARYLPPQMFRFALLTCLQLELKTHQYAEAMTTGKRLEKAGIDDETAAQLRTAVEQMKRLQTDNSSYEVAGQISDSNWFLHLFKNHFRAVVSEGYISEVRLRCDKHFVFFAFDSNLQYEVSSKDGKCSIELVGAPGTRFKFIQF